METSFFGKMKSTVLIMAVMNQYAAERMYVQRVFARVGGIISLRTVHTAQSRDVTEDSTMPRRYTEHGYSIFYLSFTVLTLIAAIKARMEKSITVLDTVRLSAH